MSIDNREKHAHSSYEIQFVMRQRENQPLQASITFTFHQYRTKFSGIALLPQVSSLASSACNLRISVGRCPCDEIKGIVGEHKRLNTLLP
jgi:hypothetical protein